MATLLCPTCRRLVLSLDRRCRTCEATLPPPETIPAAPMGGALWLDSLWPAPVPGAQVPTLVQLAPRPDADPPPARAAKAATRAAVRRARLAQSGTRDAAGLTEVLVLDADNDSRDTLCRLLEGFGFRVVCADDTRHAIEWAERQAFAAAFVDVALDESDDGCGIELCRELRALRSTMAVVLLAAEVHPVDHVRARLAGCDALIGKPARRGDVARTLEDSGVPLPSDARRH
jgi:CheY-like chemotaxis protein